MSEQVQVKYVHIGTNESAINPYDYECAATYKPIPHTTTGAKLFAMFRKYIAEHARNMVEALPCTSTR
jgi:hypothetical protein